MPPHPPDAERARGLLRVNKFLVWQRDSFLIMSYGLIAAALMAGTGSALSPELVSVGAEAWASLCPCPSGSAPSVSGGFLPVCQAVSRSHLSGLELKG